MAKKDPIETQNEKFDKLTKLLEETNRRDKIEDSRDARIALIQDKRNAMMAEAADVSYEEAERRNAHNDEILKLEKERKEKAEIAGDKSVAVRKMDRVIARKKYIEDKRIQLQNAFTLEGIQDGIKNVAESVGGKIAATGSVLMKGIGVLALFAFIQSDMFKAGVKFLVEFLTEFADLLDPNGKTSLGLNKATAGLAIALGLLAVKIFGFTAVVSGISTAFTVIGGALATAATTASAALSTFFTATLLPAVKGMLIALGPALIPVALIAAAAYGLVKLFRSFEENFTKASDEFGFFGGIVVSVTDAVRDIFVGILEFLDYITGGMFDFGIIEYVKNLDIFAGLRTVIEYVSNFFSGFGQIISDAISSIVPDWIKKWIPGTQANAQNVESSQFQTNFARAGAAMSGGEEDPARFIARKENEDMMMRRKEEMMGDKRAVNIVNNNSVVKGGDSYSEVRGGDIRIHDSANDPYTNMT